MAQRRWLARYGRYCLFENRQQRADARKLCWNRPRWRRRSGPDLLQQRKRRYRVLQHARLFGLQPDPADLAARVGRHPDWQRRNADRRWPGRLLQRPPSSTTNCGRCGATSRRNSRLTFLSSVQAGVNYTDRPRSSSQTSISSASPPTPMERSAFPFRIEFRLGTADTFLGLGPMIAYDPLDLIDAGIYNLVPNPYGDVVVKSYSSAKSCSRRMFRRTSGHDLGSTQLTGNFGVQAIFTEQRSQGRHRRSSSARTRTARRTSASTVNDDKVDYVDVLPSLNLSFRMPSDFVIRFALAREIIRSRLDDLRTRSATATLSSVRSGTS